MQYFQRLFDSLNFHFIKKTSKQIVFRNSVVSKFFNYSNKSKSVYTKCRCQLLKKNMMPKIYISLREYFGLYFKLNIKFFLSCFKYLTVQAYLNKFEMC